MIVLRSTSRFGLPQRPRRNTSRAGILSGAPWFFIAKSAGWKPTTNFKRRGAPKRKRIRRCNFICGGESCEICGDSSRATELLCVVEQPTDILPLEKTGVFRGRYHSLGGKISPLDHVGPEDLRIKELLQRIDQKKITEIIFALPADVEGESTTNYIVDLLKDKPISLTRIARGIPAGGGLESADELTLAAALSGRTKL